MRSVAFLPVITAFLLNPAACSAPAESQYQYGAEELRAALEGTWNIAIRTDGGSSAALTVELEQGRSSQHAAKSDSRGWTGSGAPSFVRVAHACGTRTLIATASACIDSTEMPLAVTFQAGDRRLGDAVLWEDGGDSSSLEGHFRVDSLVFDSGSLYLTLGEVRVQAIIDSEGVATSATLDAPVRGTVTLERVAP
jgi:hypothetical protein